MSILYELKRDIAAIKLTFTSETPAVTGITRTDWNGTNPVRTIAATLPASSFVVVDYEAALSGPIVYEYLRSNGTSTTIPEPLTLEGGDYGEAIIMVCDEPQRRAETARLLLDPIETRVQPVAPDAIIGRPDVLPTGWPLRTRTVTWKLLYESYAAAAACAAIAALGKTLLLRQTAHEGLDAYLWPTSTRITSPADGRLWIVELAGETQNWPSGHLLGAPDWTYDTLAASFSTYDALRPAFSDYIKLQAGPA